MEITLMSSKSNVDKVGFTAVHQASHLVVKWLSGSVSLGLQRACFVRDLREGRDGCNCACDGEALGEELDGNRALGSAAPFLAAGQERCRPGVPFRGPRGRPAPDSSAPQEGGGALAP